MTAMKIYVAGSFKQQPLCRLVGKTLRSVGHDVYVFCDLDATTRRLSYMVRASGVVLNPQTALANPLVQEICALNMMEVSAADACVVVLPSGRSAHFEAGIMKGAGKHVYVIGDMQDGEWDAMYGEMDGVFNLDELDLLLAQLQHVHNIMFDAR
jgi:nucleoside 2-deoxyribosyltransferase